MPGVVVVEFVSRFRILLDIIGNKKPCRVGSRNLVKPVGTTENQNHTNRVCYKNCMHLVLHICLVENYFWKLSTTSLDFAIQI